MSAHHIRYALRALIARPGFAAAAVLILTIGVGATTTVFSVVNAVMLRPLPFRDPDRLVVLWETSPRIAVPQMFVSPPNYADWASRSQSFEKNLGLDHEPGPNVYVPYLQAGGSARVTFVLRTALDPTRAVSEAGDAIRGVDAGLPLFDVRTMQEAMDRAMAPPRFVALLLSSFATIAMLLAVAGVFGVMSETVARQTREIGVRLAIGADATAVMRMVLGRAARMTVAGLLAGLAVTIVSGRVLRGLLFDIGPTDLRTFGVSAAIMMAAALAAASVPALRAVRIDPVGALRSE